MSGFVIEQIQEQMRPLKLVTLGRRPPFLTRKQSCAVEAGPVVRRAELRGLRRRA